LDKIVEVLTAALVAAGELACERKKPLDERLAGRLIAVVCTSQESAIGARPLGPRLGVRWICSRQVNARGSIVQMLHKCP